MKSQKFGLVLALTVLSLLGSSVASAQARPVASPPPASARATPAQPSPEGVVNINAASEEELQRLPGVGPARAEAIVRLRARVQRFRAADDLVRVRGIGRASMRRLRPFVALQGDTTLLARPSRRAPAPSEASH
ncbi:MAG: helix-hairpin-helix domain-containing protein [Deltaproteobacteria bacterium]|nr:helix-hairpin-helix domain-containing protein [Deltaproteobacteria bacterium]